ncbi:probable calcium-binding protein CML45 [Sesamum indicum]|uniref:Probable calcium-binding protein CML45 n=1 Tax=Sesamum indicum TaxID=4182 RepID=A0A6I9TQR1_SESIN|nr:probable calcium-binding protein CML45 [Sesamum indicum]
MSHYEVNQFPFEHFSLNTIQLTVLIVGLIEFLLLQLLIDRKRIHTFFLGLRSSTQSQLIGPDGSKHQADFKPSDKQEDRVDQSVSSGEIEIVLRSLGMCCNSIEAKVPARLDADDLFNLFEGENPNLEEVKEAFDVFDSNRDGFIDAEELQKVLCALGLKEGSEMENCRRMIGLFDENGDGRIDFDEFVKFMESSLC